MIHVANILDHDITFGVGPAGTGKTYLAVAAAVDAGSARRFAKYSTDPSGGEAGENSAFLRFKSEGGPVPASAV